MNTTGLPGRLARLAVRMVVVSVMTVEEYIRNGSEEVQIETFLNLF
jgi:hypothetical protein